MNLDYLEPTYSDCIEYIGLWWDWIDETEEIYYGISFWGTVAFDVNGNKDPEISILLGEPIYQKEEFLQGQKIAGTPLIF